MPRSSDKLEASQPHPSQSSAAICGRKAPSRMSDAGHSSVNQHSAAPEWSGWQRGARNPMGRAEVHDSSDIRPGVHVTKSAIIHLHQGCPAQGSKITDGADVLRLAMSTSISGGAQLRLLQEGQAHWIGGRIFHQLQARSLVSRPCFISGDAHHRIGVQPLHRIHQKQSGSCAGRYRRISYFN